MRPDSSERMGSPTADVSSRADAGKIMENFCPCYQTAMKAVFLTPPAAANIVCAEATSRNAHTA
eukprot:11436903-Heterocapsa_arctica.AAC.1